MRNLKIKYVRAKNILCFGEDGIELYLDDFSNVVQIKGLNLDNPGTTDEDRSNGSGKSSIPEILSIALYGKTIKYPKKLRPKNIINTLASEGEVEIIWDDYRVTRRYKKGKTDSISTKLKIWESSDQIWDKDSEQTKGTMAESQKWIEEKIGLTHRAFCSVVVFEDSDRNSFLEMDAAEKREFVENLLGIDVFRRYHEVVKSNLKEKKKASDALAVAYEQLKIAYEQCGTRLGELVKKDEDWTKTKKSEIELLNQKITMRQEKLKETDLGQKINEWEQAQNKILELQNEIETNQSKKERFQEAIESARSKSEGLGLEIESIKERLQEGTIEVRELRSEISSNEKLVESLSGLKVGATCDKCLSVINPANYGHVLSEAKGEIDSLNSKVQVRVSKMKEVKVSYDEKVENLKKLQTVVSEADKKMTALNNKIQSSNTEIMNLNKITKPDGDAEQIKLETEITALRKAISEKEKELEKSPYQEIVLKTEKEKVDRKKDIENKSVELKKLEEEIPYYEFWYKAFGDDGIRKYVIEGIIPALNSRISYWMDYLIDGVIKIEFDNSFQAAISRSGNAVDYHGMSKSERRKINLSISQALAYVMMINSGSCPSLVFLDEITGGSIDRAGVIGIHKMIFELAKERQVFVTTHNENLMNMMGGCQTINLVKENDVSQIID